MYGADYSQIERGDDACEVVFRTEVWQAMSQQVVLGHTSRGYSAKTLLILSQEGEEEDYSLQVQSHTMNRSGAQIIVYTQDDGVRNSASKVLLTAMTVSSSP